MRGTIDAYGDAMFEVSLVGSRGQFGVFAVVDTGFSGAVCLPVKLAIQFGLELISEVPVEYADGTKKAELVFTGEIVWDGRSREVEVYLTRGEEVLIGKQLFEDGVLEIDYPRGNVLFRP